MNLLPILLGAVLILNLGCGGQGTVKATTTPGTSYEFRRLCLTLGAPDSRISREAFLAQANDKAAAAQVFDACDVNRDLFITEEEANRANYLESLKGQVIRLTTP
jgi:hypothetical protein